MSQASAKLWASWGAGPARSGAEVMAFQDALRQLGLKEPDVCVLGAWLGGAPAGKFSGAKFWEYTFRETAAEACERQGLEDGDVDAAFGRLQLRDPDFAKLLEDKALNKAHKELVNEQENVKQDVDEAVDAAKKVVGDALSLENPDGSPTWLAKAGYVLVAVVVVGGGVFAWRWMRALTPGGA